MSVTIPTRVHELVRVETPELHAAGPLRAIDRVEIERTGESLILRATKTVDVADPYMRGHFPGFTIFPGVFILEAVCQTVSIGLRNAHGMATTLETIISVRFLAPLFAGDRLALDITVGRVAPGDHVDVAAECRRRDGVVCARLKLRVRGKADGRD